MSSMLQKCSVRLILLVLNLRKFGGLKYNFCPGMRSFEFMGTWNPFTNVWCTEADSEFRIKVLYLTPKSVLKGSWIFSYICQKYKLWSSSLYIFVQNIVRLKNCTQNSIFKPPQFISTSWTQKLSTSIILQQAQLLHKAVVLQKKATPVKRKFISVWLWVM
jgi:hypothetical protein